MISRLLPPQVRPMAPMSHWLTTPAGYKPAAAKSADEYAQLDANDESLARWKGAHVRRQYAQMLTCKVQRASASSPVPAGPRADPRCATPPPPRTASDARR